MTSVNGFVPAARALADARPVAAAAPANGVSLLRECDLGFDPEALILMLSVAQLHATGEQLHELESSPAFARMLSPERGGRLLDFHAAVVEGVFDPERLPALLEERRSIVLQARHDNRLEFFLILRACAQTGTAQIWRGGAVQSRIERLRIAELPRLFPTDDPLNFVLLEPLGPLGLNAADHTHASSGEISLADGIATGAASEAAGELDVAALAHDWARLMIEFPRGTACDLAMVKHIEARDFNTAQWGSSVRNITQVKKLIERSELGVTFFRQQLVHRDYIAFVGEREGKMEFRFVVGVNPDTERLHCKVCDLQAVTEEQITARHLNRLLEARKTGAWRMILGPHVRFEARSKGPYHEVQCGNSCGLHALNAALGGPVVSKFEFDKHVMRNERELLTEDFNEDDFFLNQPTTDLSQRDCAPDDSISLDRLSSFIDGHVRTATLIDHPVLGFVDSNAIKARAKLCESRVDAIIMLNEGHYVTFRKSERGWLLIDSNSALRPVEAPTRHIARKNGTLDPKRLGLIGLKMNP